MLLEQVYRHWLSLALTVLALISLASLLPLNELPAVPGSDKTHHLLAYGLLALPIALRRHGTWLGLLVLCLLWSGLIEVVQPYVNRYGEWLDLAANAMGLLLGAVVGRGLRRYLPMESD